MSGYCILVLYFLLSATHKIMAVHLCHIQPYCVLSHKQIYVCMIMFQKVVNCGTLNGPANGLVS